MYMYVYMYMYMYMYVCRYTYSLLPFINMHFHSIFISHLYPILSLKQYVYIVNIIHIPSANAWPIEILGMQRIYKYIKNVRHMPYYKMPKQAWNIGCKVQKS